MIDNNFESFSIGNAHWTKNSDGFWTVDYMAQEPKVIAVFSNQYDLARKDNV